MNEGGFFTSLHQTVLAPPAGEREIDYTPIFREYSTLDSCVMVFIKVTLNTLKHINVRQ